MLHKDAMNQLNVSLQHSITTLAAHGWSHRRIARELDIHRETVGRHLRLAGSKPAKVLPGSAPDPAAKPAIPLAGSEPLLELKPAIPLTGGLAAGRQSLCVPLQAVIESAVQAGLSAQRIYQDLICDHAFTGGYHSVQRFVRQLLQTQPVPFVRMEVAPGRKPRWILVRGRGSGGRQTEAAASVSGRLESFAQRLQRSGLAADDRELHPVSGKCVSLLWRRSPHADHRQPAGGGDAGRLV